MDIKYFGRSYNIVDGLCTIFSEMQFQSTILIILSRPINQMLRILPKVLRYLKHEAKYLRV